MHLTVNPASSSHQDVHQYRAGPPIGGPPIAIDNPMPHRLPEGENATPLEVIGTTASDKLVIIMVGLPATGEFVAQQSLYILRVPYSVLEFPKGRIFDSIHHKSRLSPS